jgi:hypothetical protein
MAAELAPASEADTAVETRAGGESVHIEACAEEESVHIEMCVDGDVARSDSRVYSRMTLEVVRKRIGKEAVEKARNDVMGPLSLVVRIVHIHLDGDVRLREEGKRRLVAGHMQHPVEDGGQFQAAVENTLVQIQETVIARVPEQQIEQSLG